MKPDCTKTKQFNGRNNRNKIFEYVLKDRPLTQEIGLLHRNQGQVSLALDGSEALEDIM